MNTPKNNTELSIQITLNGFSFSINSPQNSPNKTLQNVKGFDLTPLQQFQNIPTTAEWSTPMVQIIPYDLFDHTEPEKYLTSTHMIDKQTQRTMFAVNQDLVAIWAVDQKIYDTLDQTLLSIQHTHSLLKLLLTAPPTPNHTYIYIDPVGLMHLLMFSEYGLETAQSLRIASPTDLLFHIKLLSTRNPALTNTIHLLGRTATRPQNIQLLQSYFPNILTTL